MKRKTTPRVLKKRKTFHQALRAKLGYSPEEARQYEYNLLLLITNQLMEQGYVQIPGLMTISTQVIRRRDNTYSETHPWARKLQLKVIWDGLLIERLREFRKTETEKQIAQYQEEYEDYCQKHPGFRASEWLFTKEAYQEFGDEIQQVDDQRRALMEKLRTAKAELRKKASVNENNS